MKSGESHLKPTPVPPIFFRIKPDVYKRLRGVLTAHKLDRNALARTALMREIERLEAQASPVDSATLRVVAEAQRLEIDVKAVLKTAIKAA